MSTELNELGDYITRLVTVYMDVAQDGGDLVDAVAELLAPMGYVVTGSEYYVDLVQRANKHKAEPVPEKSTLSSILITDEEILDWDIHIEARPDGYLVQIETGLDDGDLEVMVPANMHPVSLERCRELVADLESIQQAISVLGVDEWPVIAHLDEQRSTAMNDLADEMLALLASNNLIGGDDA